MLALAQQCHSGIHPIWATYSRTALLEAAADRGWDDTDPRPIEIPRGEPENPLAAGEVQAKFRSLVAGVLEDTAAEQIWRLVVDDVSGRSRAVALLELTQP